METELEDIQTGYRTTKEITELYDMVPDSKPFYIQVDGQNLRIRKGFVGVLLTIGGALGMILSDDKQVQKASAWATGAGLRLMEEDIGNSDSWFTFK